MAETYAQQLTRIQGFIDRIEKGEYLIREGERYFQGMLVSDIYKREARLRRAVARQSGNEKPRQGVQRRRIRYADRYY